jgi:MAP/microtubule affinity-regulating kinase
LTTEFKKNYLVGKVVGEGAYATVRIAIYKPKQLKVALKIYEKTKIK